MAGGDAVKGGRRLTLELYLEAWAVLAQAPAYADGDPGSPVCRWCRMQGLVPAGKRLVTYGTDVLVCPRCDVPDDALLRPVSWAG